MKSLMTRWNLLQITLPLRLLGQLNKVFHGLRHRLPEESDFYLASRLPVYRDVEPGLVCDLWSGLGVSHRQAGQQEREQQQPHLVTTTSHKSPTARYQSCLPM